MTLNKLILCYVLIIALIFGMLFIPYLTPIYLPVKEKEVGNFIVRQEIHYGYQWTIETKVTEGDSVIYSNKVTCERIYPHGWKEEVKEVKKIKKLAKDKWKESINIAKNGKVNQVEF